MNRNLTLTLAAIAACAAPTLALAQNSVTVYGIADLYLQYGHGGAGFTLGRGQDHVHLAGPFSLVMSQDQTWFGPVANSSGLWYCGCRSWSRRSRISCESLSKRYIVRIEHR